MGFLWKAILVVLLLASLSAGAWLISLLLFGVLAYPYYRRTRGGGRPSEEGRGKMAGFKPRWRLLAAGFLIVISLVAFAGGGVVSPIFFGGLGLALVFGGRLRLFRSLSGVRPVGGSVLLRHRSYPIRWYAVAELKFVTREVSRVLSGAGGQLLLKFAGTTSAYLLFETTSLTRSGAESAVGRELRRAVRHFAPLGAYPLPLDSVAASTLFGVGLEREEIEDSEWPGPLEVAGFDWLVLKPQNGFLESVGAYHEEGEAPPSVPEALHRPRTQPLMHEVFEALDRRAVWPEPDHATSFLRNLYAARAAPPGELMQVASGPDGGAGVVVSSMYSPPTEMDRVQVRAIWRAYRQGR